MFGQANGRFRLTGFTIDSNGKTSDEPYYVSTRKPLNSISLKQQPPLPHGQDPAAGTCSSDMDWTSTSNTFNDTGSPSDVFRQPSPSDLLGPASPSDVFGKGSPSDAFRDDEIAEESHFQAASADMMDFDDLKPVHSHESVGVSRLISQFENKDFSPPLPPRPINNASGSFATNSSMSSYFGSLNAAAHVPNTGSPLASPTDSTFSTFSRLNRVTSPFDSTPVEPSSSYFSFGNSYQDLRSPVIGSSSTPFGSMDGFSQLNNTNVHSPIDSGPITPMSNQPSLTPSTIGTPGFEIWKAPTAPTIKQEPSSNTPTSSTFSPTITKPPIPTTPKPNIPTSDPLFVEYNPKSKAKGKAPVKPPRPRMPPPPPPRVRARSSSTSTTTSIPVVKPDPDTKGAFDLSSLPEASPSQSSSSSLRPQSGTRPSRELVPAEAWEQRREVIRTLYLDQRKSLKEVIAFMTEQYNFTATPKMYKTRFAQWGFVKNNTEDEVKRLLSMKFQRDAEGKVSEFVRNGKVVNLGTYLKRKGVTEYDLVDFDVPVNLPEYIRCRTPTPPLSASLRSPDLIKAQELILVGTRRAYLQCYHHEQDTNTKIGWSSIQVWGALSSEQLLESNFYFEAGDNDSGGQVLIKAFNQLEHDLKQMSPQGINEVLLGMVGRDTSLVTALCKYLSAYGSTNLDRSHPLRQIFTCLYEIQQKHGSETISQFLSETFMSLAEELEGIYGRKHPYVVRLWLDLALVYNQVNREHLERLVLELRAVQQQVERDEGEQTADNVLLRFALMQLLHASGLQADATKKAAEELWDLLKRMKTVYSIRNARSNMYCYHSPVKVDPWTKRCLRRYDSGVTMLEEHCGVKLQPYFEEQFHVTEHALDTQDSWASALSQQGIGGRWNFL